MYSEDNSASTVGSGREPTRTPATSVASKAKIPTAIHRAREIIL